MCEEDLAYIYGEFSQALEGVKTGMSKWESTRS